MRWKIFTRYRGPADGKNRRRGKAAAYRAQPQRPGGDGFQTLGPRRHRQPCGAGERPHAGLGEPAVEHSHSAMPGFTHLQNRATGHLRPPSAGLCGNARARSRQAARCPNPAERMPAGRRRPGRNLVSDRPAHDGRGIGFRPPTANSLDSVSDRDFALEYLSSVSILAMHLSRFSEEIVIWCSAPYQLVALSDAFTTGSSIMPQKRNPDAAELTRRKPAGFLAR